jgi:hypothetical protein
MQRCCILQPSTAFGADARATLGKTQAQSVKAISVLVDLNWSLDQIADAPLNLQYHDILARLK